MIKMTSKDGIIRQKNIYLRNKTCRDHKSYTICENGTVQGPPVCHLLY
jgi:hypothetical protein